MLHPPVTAVASRSGAGTCWQTSAVPAGGLFQPFSVWVNASADEAAGNHVKAEAL